MPLLENPNTPWFRPLLSSFRNTKDPGRQGSCFPSYSVRDDEWHYIRYFTNGATFPAGCDEATSVMQEELYHIGKKKNIDPYEWNNLAGDPAYNYIKDYLATYLPDGVNYLQFEKESYADVDMHPVMDITVFPNPTTAETTIMITGEKGNADLHFYNVFGQLILDDQIELDQNGSIGYSLNVKNWPAGYYVVKVHQNETQTAVTFVVE